ncbi:MAG: hypothetical protein CM1200mP3_11220 [Chloroflexota bacterium]|nr:MAG: hypothetical protein CM1200mP3_11220 [Chloroflexota bacterium]
MGGISVLLGAASSHWLQGIIFSDTELLIPRLGFI